MRLILVLITILFTSCYNKAATPETPLQEQVSNTSIARLKQICNTETVTFTATAPIVIRGTVISSDKEGYISGAMYIDDGTETAKLLVDVYDLHSIYPEGAQVSISLPGLTATIEDYQLTIGIRVYDRLNGLKSIVQLDKHITCAEKINKIAPLNCNITDITHKICGKLVTINKLNYVYTCYDEGYYGKYLRFCDQEQNHIYLYIDNYAAGFSNLAPQEPTDITGIVTYQNVPFDTNDCFVILPRQSRDIWH